jgi:hypothetical protein
MSPTIRDGIQQVTDGISPSTGPVRYTKHQTNRGLLILNDLLYAVPLSTVVNIRTGERLKQPYRIQVKGRFGNLCLSN